MLIISAGWAEDDKNTSPEPKSKSPTGALLRSMVVPGWGQLYNGKWFKGLVYAGTQLGFLFSAHVQNNRYHDFLNQGDEVVAQFYKNDRNRLIWWLFGITLLSMGDAYTDAHLYRFDISDDLSARIGPEINPNFTGIGFSIKLTFGNNH